MKPLPNPDYMNCVHYQVQFKKTGKFLILLRIRYQLKKHMSWRDFSLNKKRLLFILGILLILLVQAMPPHSRVYDLSERGIISIPEQSAYYGDIIKRDYTGTFKAVVLLTEFPDQPHQ